MAYQKHLGEGVIISLSEWGESGRTLRVLTREGVRSLVATGVRELGSKMRGEIDVLSKVEFEYVEGKDVSRLVGIFPREKLLNLVGDKIVSIRNAISNVTNFLLRIVVGETENDKLYEDFLVGLAEIQKVEEDIQVVEIVWMIKILVCLGYWEEGVQDKFDVENYKYVSGHKKELIVEINKSIESSHL